MDKPNKRLKALRFGKRVEYGVACLMLKEDIGVYIPLVDVEGIDIVGRREDGTFVEVQVKAVSKCVKLDDVAYFAKITKYEQRDNYYYVFYSEYFDTYWIMTSKEFIEESSESKGERSIRFTCTRDGKKYRARKYDKYIAEDFSLLVS